MTPFEAENVLWNLTVAARLEGDISDSERKILYDYACRLGISPDRTQDVIRKAGSETPPKLKIPKQPEEQMETLTGILDVVASDGTLHPKEFAVARSLANRMGLSEHELQKLSRAALKESRERRQRVYQAVGRRTSKRRGNARSQASSGEVELAPVDRPPGESKRSRHMRLRGAISNVPIVARLARGTKECGRCGGEFADRSPYARVCGRCRGTEESAAAPSKPAMEKLFMVLFVASLVPCGFLIEALLGLWSWGWSTGTEVAEPFRDSWLRNTRRFGETLWFLILIVPITATAILGFLVSWGLHTAIRSVTGKVSDRSTSS